MAINTRVTSLVAAVMGAICIAPIQPPSATAEVRATGGTTLTIQSGRAILFASDTQTFTNPGTAASIPVVGNVAKTFWINNGGSLNIKEFIITVNLPNNANVNSFRLCPINVSFVGKNVCESGTSTQFNLVPGVAKTFKFTLPSMNFYSFQIVENKSGTMEVNTSVSTLNIETGTANS